MNGFDQESKFAIWGPADAEADPEFDDEDTDTDPGMIRMVPDTPSPCFVIVMGICIFPSTVLKMEFPLESFLTMEESIGG